MGLGSWLATGLWTPVQPAPEPQPEQRLTSIADPALAVLFGYPSLDGLTVSETTALNLSAVFRAVSLVAGSVGSLPLRTLERVGDDATERRRVSSFLDSPGGPGRHPRYTPVEWAELSMVHLLLHGNAYLQHIYNGAGALAALLPVHPLSVVPEWDDTRPGGKRFDVSVTTANGEPQRYKLDARTMTQVMGPSLDGLAGLSVLTRARLSLSTGLAGERSANRQFVNGAMISGIITPADSEMDLSPTEAAAVKETVNRVMTGPEHAGDIPVLSRRLEFTPWQMSAQDAQFLESRTFSVDEVGRWFGVPPHLLGLTEKSTSWGQGIAEQNRGLARYTLTPWTGRLEQRLSLLLPGAPRRWAEFDYTAFVKPSPEDEIGLLIEQVNSGLLTLNEARAIRNLGPLPGGDVPRTPAGAASPDAAPAGTNGGQEDG